MPCASRRGLNAHVRRLCAEDGLTVLWATHLIEGIEPEDRVLIMHQGQLLADGHGDTICADQGQPTLADTFQALTGTEQPTTRAN